MLQHTIRQMNQFAHHGADNGHAILAVGLHALDECLHDRIEAHGGEGGQEQSGAKTFVAGFDQTPAAVNRRSGIMVSGRQTGVGSELVSGLEVIDIQDFGNEPGGCDVADAGNGGQEVVLLAQIRMLVKKVTDALLDDGDLVLEEVDMGIDISQDSLGLNARLLPIQFSGAVGLERFKAACESL